MGCGSSKVEDLPVVAFCRERRDLIGAAVDHRFAFAACHESYFRALEGVGEALQRFVQEELTVVPTPSPSSGTPSSPVLTIPSSEGKTPKPKGGSPAGSAASGAIASGGGSSSSPSSQHSLSPEGSHLHLSTDSDSDEIPESGGNGGSGVPYSYASLDVPSPRYSYMRHSTAIPAMVYEAPFSGYGYASPSGLPDGYPGAPMNSNPAGDPSSYYYYGPQMPPQVPPPTPPEIPPPPAPEVSTWDFLNPFQSYEQIYSSYRLGSLTSSPDSSEVREQEGIPDLEEETESELSGIPKKRKKMNVNASAEPGPSSSKSVPTSDKHATVTEDKGSRNSSEGSNLKSSGGSSTNRGSGDGSTSNSSGKGSKTRGSGDESKLKDIEEEETRKKEVTFELETSLPTDNSGPTLETVLSTEGSRNITAVTREIKEQFKLAATSGREVSAMLEVGKLRYQSRNAILKVFSSRILDYFPILAHSYHTFKGAHYSTIHSLKSSKISVRSSGNLLNVKYGNLSTTMEKLSVWEKKLYKEVKIGIATQG